MDTNPRGALARRKLVQLLSSEFAVDSVVGVLRVGVVRWL